MKESVIAVGLGELHWTRDPNFVLVCYGLGSCIGVSMYDPISRFGAMAHIVLPDSSMARDRDAPSKFADTCIPTMLELMDKQGAKKPNLVVKLAGGAQVLSIPGMVNRLDIGNRNIDAVRHALEQARLKPVAIDVGGNFGRTMQLFVREGKVTIRAVGKGEKEL